MHLKSFENGIYEGLKVKQGDVIGYVGNTGNAKNTLSHLHFGVVKLVKNNCLKCGKKFVNPLVFYE